jgi:hypothetical protein
MATTPEQIDLWRQSPSEHQRLEFKEAKNQFDNHKLYEYCVALNETTRDSYTSSLAVESSPLVLSVAKRSRRAANPVLRMLRLRPAGYAQHERCWSVVYQCRVV